MHVLRFASASKVAAALLLLLVASLSATQARADSGGFVGGSVGRGSLEFDAGLFEFDEGDTAFKAFGGYIFDLPAVDFSVEGGYVDFGKPSGGGLDIDVTGVDVFAVGGLDFGLVGVFAKAGLVSWDADLQLGPFSESDDGTDRAYGLGLRFHVGSVYIRAEYENFDIEDTDDVDMISAGIVWRF